MEPWSGIADADAYLGRRVPLPTATLPLARWVEVRPAGTNCVEVEWNLDDTRDGTPGRLALYAGTAPPDEREWPVGPKPVRVGAAEAEHRVLPLDEADAPLKPAHELRWQLDGLHLRLTAQGPWRVEDLVSIGESIRA